MDRPVARIDDELTRCATYSVLEKGRNRTASRCDVDVGDGYHARCWNGSEAEKRPPFRPGKARNWNGIGKNEELCCFS
jgi:hypothetical protein